MWKNSRIVCIGICSRSKAHIQFMILMFFAVIYVKQVHFDVLLLNRKYITGYKDEGTYSCWWLWNTLEAIDPECTEATGWIWQQTHDIASGLSFSIPGASMLNFSCRSYFLLLPKICIYSFLPRLVSLFCFSYSAYSSCFTCVTI